MIEQPLSTKPITELHMSCIDEIYVRRVYWYLEHTLECKVESEPDGRHHITFPDGTVEEVYPGQSTPWTYKTTIRFPNGRTLSKYKSVNVRNMMTATFLLYFPNVL